MLKRSKRHGAGDTASGGEEMAEVFKTDQRDQQSRPESPRKPVLSPRKSAPIPCNLRCTAIPLMIHNNKYTRNPKGAFGGRTEQKNELSANNDARAASSAIGLVQVQRNQKIEKLRFD